MLMLKVSLLVLMSIAAVGLTACSAPAEAPTPTSSSTPAASAPEVVRGDGILIETRITDARAHTGEVLDGSLLGESAFCPGGTSTGSSQGAVITTIFECPEGTLTVTYAPTQFSLVQSSPWEIASGTGSFEGLIGGGSMVAAFGPEDPDSGREIFTGTVAS